jgi:D-arabinose 1-dehydrogenase-like Zn-dependent alcohol dehydrogenase
MQAVVLKQPGGTEQMSLEEIPTPEATDGRVLVKVRACGVAHRDVIERRGGHPFLATPIVQGHEFAGEVVAIGGGVGRWQPGDRVVNLYTDSCGTCEHCVGGEERLCTGVSEAYGLITNGGYAEFALLRERGLERLSDGIAWDQGAVLMSAIAVGYNNVVNTAAVRPGEHVLVTGASGGVGLAALQTAKLLGARTWAVTSSPHKRPELEALGADRVLVDRDGRFHKQVREQRPEGIDAVIDCVGEPTLNASVRSLRRFGRVAVVGTLDTPRVELNLGYLVVNSIKLLGSDNVSRKALRETMALVADGRIEVRIDRRLPLSAAAEAHALVEQRQVVGRVVLVPEHA